MELLDKDVRDEVFNPARPVYTKVRNSAPTIYTKDAKVKNSLIADGCVIEGEVENSIIFRGVRIRKGTVVRNSIMLQDSCTGENVELNCVITDKNVTIRDDRKLCGAESLPYYISKGKMI
jgi:glucose-1-phosphate adenylyltransferase